MRCLAQLVGVEQIVLVEEVDHAAGCGRTGCGHGGEGPDIPFEDRLTSAYPGQQGAQEGGGCALRRALVGEPDLRVAGEERVRGIIPDNVAVSGLTAMTDDLTRQLADTLPVFIAAIIVVSFLLLMLVFRSVAVPLKAAVMNLLSIGGAYGVVVAVFQWGWLGGLFNLHETMLIASPLPTIFFAVLFGLSMDYEVFLLSRVREEYDATSDPTESVARAMAVTGRVITSAALIMTVVFLSFVANPSPLVKMMGLGLATAIVLDATIVRMVLVPASMALLGRAAWWLPRPLDRRLPRIAVETVESMDAVESNESDDLPPPPEPTPAPTARIS